MRYSNDKISMLKYPLGALALQAACVYACCTLALLYVLVWLIRAILTSVVL